jgi:hypothetical protein
MLEWAKHIFQYQSQSCIYYTMPAECRNVTMDRLYVSLLYMQGVPCATNLHPCQQEPHGRRPSKSTILVDIYTNHTIKINNTCSYIHQSYRQNQQYLSIYTPIMPSKSTILVDIHTNHTIKINNTCWYTHQSYHQNQWYLSIYTPINSSESLFFICVKIVHIDPIVTDRDQHDCNCAQWYWRTEGPFQTWSYN